MAGARLSTALLCLLLLALTGGRGEAGVPRRITSSCLPAQLGERLAIVKALRGGGRRRRKDWQSPRPGDSDYQGSESSDPEWGDRAAAREEDSDEDFRIPDSAEDAQGGGSESESSYVTPARSSRAPARNGQWWKPTPSLRPGAHSSTAPAWSTHPTHPPRLAAPGRPPCLGVMLCLGVLLLLAAGLGAVGEAAWETGGFSLEELEELGELEEVEEVAEVAEVEEEGRSQRRTLTSR
ncbi:hypothetical protein T484DRAFT_1874783 [Baffinella frigidus]|nr:hypothetical protein T484DRAFT_1874783 [Cryptophyta sp. CCMP2293]